MKPKTIAAGRFKAECLRIMDEVAAKRRPVIVTKRGRPVVRLEPAESAPKALLGGFRGRVQLHGDLTRPALTPKEWGKIWS
jgi:prevent-host-death family protein